MQRLLLMLLVNSFIVLTTAWGWGLTTVEYSCNGEDVLNINGATGDAYKEYSSKNVSGNNKTRYFKFKTDVDGTITIHQKNNKPENGYWNHQLRIGTSCGGNDIHSGSGSRDDSKTFTVTANTTYYAKVKETNSKNKLNFDISFDFKIPNKAPTANAGNSQTITVGNDVKLSGSGTDEDGTIASYKWSNGNTNASQTISGLSIGTYTYTLTVTDNDGAVSEGSSVTIKVQAASANSEPVADAGEDQNVSQEQNVTMNGSNSTDSDGSIATYSWKVNGDTYTGVDAKITSTSLKVGDNTVTLTVTDNSGATNTDSMNIHVMEVVNNADDICYADPITEGLEIMGIVKMMYRNELPLRNNTDDGETLTDIMIITDIDGMGGDFMSGCGSDHDNTDNDDTDGGECTDHNNGIDMPMGSGMTFDGKTTTTTVVDDIEEGDESNSVWSKTMFEMGFFKENLYATYVKDGKIHTGELRPCNEIVKDPEFVQCGLFPGALNTWDSINRGNSDIVLNGDTVYADGGVNGTGNQDIQCTYTDSNDDEQTEDCTIEEMNLEIPELPTFRNSIVTGNHNAQSTETDRDYGDVTVASGDTVTFNPAGKYSNGKPVMLMNSLTVKDGATVTFTKGDYWIKDWTSEAKINIRTNGKVRLFIGNNINLTENLIDFNYDSGNGLAENMFMFVYGDFEFASNGGGNTQNITAYVYVQGAYTGNHNSANSNFKGAVTAVGNINLSNNQQYEYDDSGLKDGWGSCEDCKIIQWQDVEYQVKEDYENPIPESKTVDTVIEFLDVAVDYDVTVTYTTVEGTAKSDYDYKYASDTATIPAGETSVIVPITIYNDPQIELDEHFYIDLSSQEPENDICLNENYRTKVTILQQDDAPICFSESFDSPELDSLWRTLASSGDFTPGVVKVNGDGRLRITPDKRNISTAVTKDYTFNTRLNLIIVEFDYYAYGGCNGGGLGAYGADGIVNVLFDSEIGSEPGVGAYGGSMGYAQNKRDGGFDGGWLGLGLDEYGNYSKGNENREGGYAPEPTPLLKNAVAIRGDINNGDRRSGYEYLAGTESLSPVLAKKSRYDLRNGYYSGRFKMTIDARNPDNLWITLERDADGNESNRYSYETIIDKFDAKDSQYGQGRTPDKVRYAITGGTGGGCNFHELSWLQLKGDCAVYSVQDNYMTGPFAAIDIFRWENNKPKDVNDHAISTKNVNEAFKLRIASMNSDWTAAELKAGIDVKYGLYSNQKNINQCDVDGDGVGDKVCLLDPDNYPLDSFVASTSTDEDTKEFIIKEAFSSAFVRIYYCGDYDEDSEITTLKPYSECEGISTTDAQKEKTDGTHLFYHESNHFAIKPTGFKIVSDGTNYRAGENFKLNFNATANDIDRVAGFNENAGMTFTVEVKEHNGNCIVGDFNKTIDTSWGFENGQQEVDTSYSEVGIIDINISDETLDCSERFARVDCDDKPISSKLWNNSAKFTAIGTDSVDDITFIPDYFDVNTTIENHNKVDKFTYMSNDLNMSSTLELEITSKSKNGTTTKNYNKECYAKAIDLDIDLKYAPTVSTPKALETISYQINADGSTFSKKERDLTALTNIKIDDINESIFPAGDNNGTAEVKIKVNLGRKNNRVTNPFKMAVKEVKLVNVDTIEDKAGDLHASDKNATFIYARVKTSDTNDFYDGITDPSVITPATILVYCDKWPASAANCPQVDITAGTGNSDWWLATGHDKANNDGNVTLDITGDGKFANNTKTTIVSINNGDNGIDDSVVITNTGGLPSIVDVTLNTDTSKWLIFNPSHAIDAPIPFYKVKFVGTSAWTGHGKTGHIIDSNVSKKIHNRLGW